MTLFGKHKVRTACVCCGGARHGNIYQFYAGNHFHEINWFNNNALSDWGSHSA